MPDKVLVVDDDESIRSMLVDILRYEGYRATPARDGMEALTAIERDRPDVILLDVLMPMLDGLTLSDLIRSGDGRVSIVVMSADHERARAIRADATVIKPFDLPDLLRVVRRFATPAETPESAEVPT